MSAVRVFVYRLSVYDCLSAPAECVNEMGIVWLMKSNVTFI